MINGRLKEILGAVWYKIQSYILLRIFLCSFQKPKKDMFCGQIKFLCFWFHSDNICSMFLNFWHIFEVSINLNVEYAPYSLFTLGKYQRLKHWWTNHNLYYHYLLDANTIYILASLYFYKIIWTRKPISHNKKHTF